MNIYYANGGGLGHLTRARAFLHQLKIADRTAILTNSEFAADKRVVGDLEIFKVDGDFANNLPKYRDFLQKTLAERAVKNIFLDSFPAGIIGEFADFDFGEIEVFYLARLLRWKNYAHFLSGIELHFKKTFVLEPLEPAHQNFIEKHSTESSIFDLIYADFETPDEPVMKRIIRENSPFWLIVHAGAPEEISELMNFAAEMREIEQANVELILISPPDYTDHNCFDIYPAARLFPFAERIFTAAGFNALRQTAQFRSKHFVMPFERRYDDQFARALSLALG